MLHRNSAVIGFSGCVNGPPKSARPSRPTLLDTPITQGHVPTAWHGYAALPVARPRTLSMTERTNTLVTFRSTRPLRADPQGAPRRILRPPTPDPAESHPAGPRRPRPSRHRP